MKFWMLVIAADLTMKRMWIDENAVISMLKEQKNIKIYRNSSDQEAILHENDTILWKDVLVQEVK